MGTLQQCEDCGCDLPYEVNSHVYFSVEKHLCNKCLVKQALEENIDETLG